jgi:hypothetical protein
MRKFCRRHYATFARIATGLAVVAAVVMYHHT